MIAEQQPAKYHCDSPARTLTTLMTARDAVMARYQIDWLYRRASYLWPSMALILVFLTSAPGHAKAVPDCQQVTAELATALSTVQLSVPLILNLVPLDTVDIHIQSPRIEDLRVAPNDTPVIAISIRGPAFASTGLSIPELRNQLTGGGQSDDEAIVFVGLSNRSKPDRRITLHTYGAGRVVVTWSIFGSSRCHYQKLNDGGNLSFDVSVDVRERRIRDAGSESCRIEKAILERLASQTSITIEQPKTLKAGEPISVSWGRPQEKGLPGRPLYLIVSMPEAVRLEGDSFFVIPPGARAPFQIERDSQLLHLFIPLHLMGTATSGIIKARPAASGVFNMDFSIVSGSACPERIIRRGDKVSVLVSPGTAEVVAQDPFSLETPSRAIISRNGRYRLDVFADSYRVYDLENGAVLIDRPGRYPNFSPSARFIAAMIGGEGDPDIGGQFEVVDLITGRPVSFGVDIRGPILGWALRDSLLIVGTLGHPELCILPTLIDAIGRLPACDNPPKSKGYIALMSSGRATTAWERFRFDLHLDQGLISIADGTMSYALGELASGRTERMPRKALSGLLALHGATLSQLEAWNPGEPLRLSHYSPLVDRKLPQFVDVAEQMSLANGAGIGNARKTMLQREFLETHIPADSGSAASPFAPSGGAREDWRVSGVRSSKRAPSPGVLLVAQLKLNGLDLERGETPEAFVIGTTWNSNSSFSIEHSPTFKGSIDALRNELFRDVPDAKKVIDTIGNYHPCTEIDGVTSWTLSQHAHGIWKWAIGAKKYWLVQMLCYWKGGPTNKLYLLERNADGTSQFLEVFEPIIRNIGRPTEETLSRVVPRLFNSRWLVVASRASGRAIIVDLQNMNRMNVFAGLRDGSGINELFLTRNADKLVQLNGDGRIYVYRTADSTEWGPNDRFVASVAPNYYETIAATPILVAGRWVDDELILFTSSGYFSGSYEASHFVHVKFAGAAGLYSLRRYAAVLYRPDVIDALLRDKPNALPEPRLTVPPRVQLNEIALTVDTILVSYLVSGSQELRSLRFFQDGSLCDQVELSGTTASGTKVIARHRSTRLVAAVALDVDGYESAPFAVKVEPAAKANGSLRVVAIGIDRYRDSAIPSLRFAKVDAKTLATAAKSIAGYYYESVEVSEIVDAAATRDTIIKELNDTLSKVRTEDTVLLYFAGHGTRQKKRFFMVLSDTVTSRLESTALEWSTVFNILSRSLGRVVVVLDACHSGQAGSEDLATNDEIADQTASRQISPMMILAASKGRQESEELSTVGGGVFTQTLAKAFSVDRGAYDKNADGVIELSELFLGVKKKVHDITNGRQTPWLVRGGLVGDFPLF